MPNAWLIKLTKKSILALATVSFPTAYSSDAWGFWKCATDRNVKGIGTASRILIERWNYEALTRVCSANNSIRIIARSQKGGGPLSASYPGEASASVRRPHWVHALAASLRLSFVVCANSSRLCAPPSWFRYLLRRPLFSCTSAQGADGWESVAPSQQPTDDLAYHSNTHQTYAPPEPHMSIPLRATRGVTKMQQPELIRRSKCVWWGAKYAAPWTWFRLTAQRRRSLSLFCGLFFAKQTQFPDAARDLWLWGWEGQ